MKILPKLDMEVFYELLKKKAGRHGWRISMHVDLVEDEEADEQQTYTDDTIVFYEQLDIRFWHATCERLGYYPRRDRCYRKRFLLDRHQIDLVKNLLRDTNTNGNLRRVRTTLRMIEPHSALEPVLRRRKLRALLED